ncbi:unannotated protein [freshwater metagenome]|uniref:mannose-6-phosphate isomerase n=1 Tax=freshwater metagenome TaxID=449393 RepID=A0A6J6IIK4_9ZZZZ
MLVRVSGEVKNHAWGSKTLMQDHFGIGDGTEPVAEVWFGTHPGGESTAIASGKNLSELVGSQLSFLAKFLAAASPLSIQVHPNSEHARAGYEKEQALGLSLDDASRNYRDAFHKPEILIALSKFRALCGFRPRTEILEIFLAFSESQPRFGELAAMVATEVPLKEIVGCLLEDKGLAAGFAETFGGEGVLTPEQVFPIQARDLALELLENYPGDTGALVALVMNYVELDPGQAIFLPAGNLHAYLSGLGVEVMASSDNVIRGGLTQKHIDRAELMKITDFAVLANPLVVPKKLAEGLVEYSVGAQEFRVYKADITGSNLLADLELPAAAMVLCVSGEVAVSTSLEEREVLKKADVVYMSGAKKFSLSGSGTAFVVLGA